LTGRPTKLTKDLTNKICRAIRAGNYPAVAARSCGVAESTFYRWMEEGRSAKKGLHRDFYEEVKGAEAEAEVRAVAVIAKAMSGEWRPAFGLLERRFAERWRRRERSESPVEERPVFDLENLSEKELKTLEELSARIAKPDRD
jgi:hypothetical protein